MNKEEIESLFEKYKVRIPKEKQGQSECYKCKENHKYSLTWTSFLYEYEEHYYCYEHILNILLQQENRKYKEVINKAINDLNIIIDIVREQPLGSDCWIINRLEANKSILKEVE